MKDGRKCFYKLTIHTLFSRENTYFVLLVIRYNERDITRFIEKNVVK